MIPAAFTILDTLPLTPNGKVDRKGLPAPDHSRSGLDEIFVAPQTSTQITLSQIWADVLGLDKVGIYDNFFDLGGHSLLATQVVSRIREQFQINLPLRNLFTTPILLELSEFIDTMVWATQAPSTSVDAEEFEEFEL